MIKLEERFEKYYKKLEAETLNESVKNIYEFTVIDKDDKSFQDTVEAYSYKQAKYLAHDMHKKCLIRDIKQITDNKDETPKKEKEDDGEQISMFDEKKEER